MALESEFNHLIITNSNHLVDSRTHIEHTGVLLSKSFCAIILVLYIVSSSPAHITVHHTLDVLATIAHLCHINLVSALEN